MFIIKIELVPHDPKYAKSISSLTSHPAIKDALGLNHHQTSLEGTMEFIEFILQEETFGRQYSRVILNEQKEVIGVITLKDINQRNQTCHLGTWIGRPYWGKGYNELAKLKLLHTAFTELDLKLVFVGVKQSNIRSQKALEKLPYIKVNVQATFPDEYQKVVLQAKEPCLLNVIEKEAFLKWYSHEWGFR